MIRRLVSALLSIVCVTALARYATAAPNVGLLRGPGVRMSLADFARTRTRAPLGRNVPRAWLTAQPLLAALSRSSKYYLLYVSAIDPNGTGVVNIYPGWVKGNHPPLLGQVTGLDSPTSIAVDARGTLYVCQTLPDAPVLVFPLGATTPSLALHTMGNLPVAVAVAPDGTVFVSTANANGWSAKILVYAPGAVRPSRQFIDLAGDAVADVETDVDGNVYYAGDFIGIGNYIGEVKTTGAHRSLLVFGDPVLGLALDRAGNMLVVRDAVEVRARGTGRLLRTLNIPGIESFTFNANEGAFYAADGTIGKYAYPSGAQLGSITSLAGDYTWGIATFPAAPHGRAW